MVMIAHLADHAAQGGTVLPMPLLRYLIMLIIPIVTVMVLILTILMTDDVALMMLLVMIDE